jgi:uracil-DNA glycosylase
VYVAAAVRCAPPGNKPLPAEIAACARHLDAEVAALPRLRVVVALGRIAWYAWLDHLTRAGHTLRPRPPFGHGAVLHVPIDERTPRTSTAHHRTSAPPHLRTARVMIGCYHPSRQNTNTGRVSPEMYDEVFRDVGRLVTTGSPPGHVVSHRRSIGTAS